jgi:hypothetical protein
LDRRAGAESVSDIFTEVDEDLRRERALKLWNRYGNYIVAFAIAVVVATAGVTYWKDYQHKQAEAGALRYLAALDQATTDSGASGEQALAAISRDGAEGYAVLARFQQAALKSRNGDPAGASEIYRAIAADSRTDQSLRDAAALLAALNVPDGVDPAEYERQLATLTAPTNPWRHMAREAVAIALIKAGKIAEARAQYTKISDDPDAPPGVRARAAEMLAALGNG